MNKLDFPSHNQIQIKGVMATGGEDMGDPASRGVHIQILNGVDKLYEVSIAGHDDAPGGEYFRKSPSPACGNPRDGWDAKASGSGKELFKYSNRTGLAPALGDSEGSCTGSANGVQKIQLKNNGDGTWSVKVKIKGTTLLQEPEWSGSEVTGTMQAQIAFGSALGATVSPEGTAGQCGDLQFDRTTCDPVGPAAGCTVKSKSGLLKKIMCR
jgi:hypothetical protein